MASPNPQSPLLSLFTQWQTASGTAMARTFPSCLTVQRGSSSADCSAAGLALNAKCAEFYVYNDGVQKVTKPEAIPDAIRCMTGLWRDEGFENVLEVCSAALCGEEEQRKVREVVPGYQVEVQRIGEEYAGKAEKLLAAKNETVTPVVPNPTAPATNQSTTGTPTPKPDPVSGAATVGVKGALLLALAAFPVFAVVL